ncbi:hypothetical protein, partial [Klebsiella variicola]|uniref:hypothetical protein n=1 Tax=Klebsiella variicola TaxID=244366 RepID=UPI00244104DD
ADRNRSHWSTSKTPSYTKSVSWQHHLIFPVNINYVVTLKENRIHLSSLGGTYSKFDNTNPLKFPPASKKQLADKKT